MNRYTKNVSLTPALHTKKNTSVHISNYCISRQQETNFADLQQYIFADFSKIKKTYVVSASWDRISRHFHRGR